MKKYRIPALALAAMMCLTGCKGNKDPEVTVPATEPPVTVAPTESTGTLEATPVFENMYSVSLPITVQEHTAEDGTPIYSYRYQSISLIVQDREVADKIVMDFTNRIEQASADAQEGLALAQSLYASGDLSSPITYEIQYDVTRLDQGVLSMFGHVIKTSDAAGSNRSLIAASYDMITGDMITVGSILYHIDTKAQLAQLVIDHLESRDDLTLFDEYQDTVNARFARDESVDEDFYFTDSGLCFYFAPYEIAPRANGTVIVEIPYNELTGIIGDAFFPAERTHTSGTVSIAPFQEDQWESYEQFADIVATPNADQYILTTDSAAQNIRIYQQTEYDQGLIHTETENIFAINFLGAENAILFEADLAQEGVSYLLCYNVNGETQSYKISAENGTVTLIAE